MTSREIRTFISVNNPETRGKLTRATMHSGLIWIGHFLPENQTELSMSKNKWIFIQGGSGRRLELNGLEIKSLKENI